MTFGTLALIVAVGLLGPLLTLTPARYAPPIVVGEIAAGVAIGRTGTRTLDSTQPTLAFLAAIGFALLMFIVGTHIPIRDPRLRMAGKRGLVAALVTVAIAALISPLMSAATGLHDTALLTVLVAATSAAIVLPIVQSQPQTDSLLVTLTWVTLLDVATVIAVPLVLATDGVARSVAGISLVIAGAVGVALVAEQARGTRWIATLRRRSRHEGWALDLRVSLLVLFTLAWVAERFETSILIAGFAAGVMITTLGEPRRVADQLIGIGEGFFIPLFFVTLGARLDMRALVQSASNVRLFVLLTVAAVAVPVVAARIVRLRTPYGMLAAAKMGVPAAVTTIGLSTGALHPGQGAAIVGSAAVSVLVAAAGANRVRAHP
jgi:Kef-type K+ transport system membrane component KefB